METRVDWRIVIGACVAAIAIIVAAAALAYYKPTLPKTDQVTAEQGVPDAAKTADWRSALEAIATANIDANGEYRAPKELGTTASVSRELFVTYLQLKKDGKLGTKAEDDALKDIITRNVPVITPSDTYTLGSLKVSQSATLDTYADALGDAMQKATSVREYELATFARTVGRKNYKGTPELAAAAGIYRSVEKDLLAAPVPESIAGPHLVLVQSVAFLAKTTELMGGWSGDPIEALGYVDAFVKAERNVQVSLNSLFTAIAAAGAKS